MFQPHPDVELKNPTLKFQNPDPTIYSSVENSNSKKIVSFPKVKWTPSRVNKSISPHQNGKFPKNHPGWIFFSAPSRAPFQPPPCVQPPPRYPGPVERPHFHGRDSPYETVVWPDRRSEWLRRWNPATAGSWSAIPSKWKPGCLWNSQFFVRDPYVKFFYYNPPPGSIIPLCTLNNLDFFIAQVKHLVFRKIQGLPVCQKLRQMCQVLPKSFLVLMSDILTSEFEERYSRFDKGTHFLFRAWKSCYLQQILSFNMFKTRII